MYACCDNFLFLHINVILFHNIYTCEKLYYIYILLWERGVRCDVGHTVFASHDVHLTCFVKLSILDRLTTIVLHSGVLGHTEVTQMM